jgi:hypothetical protein
MIKTHNGINAEHTQDGHVTLIKIDGVTLTQWWSDSAQKMVMSGTAFGLSDFAKVRQAFPNLGFSHGRSGTGGRDGSVNFHSDKLIPANEAEFIEQAKEYYPY